MPRVPPRGRASARHAPQAAAAAHLLCSCHPKIVHVWLQLARLCHLVEPHAPWHAEQAGMQGDGQAWVELVARVRAAALDRRNVAHKQRRA